MWAAMPLWYSHSFPRSCAREVQQSFEEKLQRRLDSVQAQVQRFEQSMPLDRIRRSPLSGDRVVDFCNGSMFRGVAQPYLKGWEGGRKEDMRCTGRSTRAWSTRAALRTIHLV